MAKRTGPKVLSAGERKGRNGQGVSPHLSLALVTLLIRKRHFNGVLWQISFSDDLVHPLCAVVRLTLQAFDAKKGVFAIQRREMEAAGHMPSTLRSLSALQ